ncbi:MAG: 50S ribosomal protein L9 [Lachnospiraceae bacterium]|nr:50S ribosomal protein L9 [Lachnospiraceae bacterium]
MEVILLQDVKSLGKKGEKVTVSDGYARNFILPKKLGVSATAVNLNDLKLKEANQARIEKEQLDAAKELQAKIEASPVTLSVKVGEGGKVFGSIASKEIATAFKEQHGLELDKKKILLDENIRTVGNYTVGVKLHRDVTAKLSVKVVEQ